MVSEIENFKKLLIKYRDLVPYTIFGIFTTIINIAVYALLYNYLGVSNVLSTIIAWITAVIYAFVTNKLYVFGSKSWERRVVLSEFNKFFAVRGGTGIFEVVFMYIFVDIFNFNGLIMKLIVNVVVVIINYLASRFMIFKKQQ